MVGHPLVASKLDTCWPTLGDLDRAARQDSLEASPYAVVPREVWEEYWR